MSFTEILQMPPAVGNTLTSMGNVLSPELLCSASVNLAILTGVLLGAVWLVAPFEPKDSSRQGVMKALMDMARWWNRDPEQSR